MQPFRFLGRTSLVTASCLFQLSVLSIATAQNLIQIEEQVVSPMNLQTNERFGTAICADNETIIVGSPRWHDGDPTQLIGTARIFTYDSVNRIWEEGALLLPNSSVHLSSFGNAVSILDTIAVVGAPLESNNAGTVTVFTNDGTGIGHHQVHH